MQSTSHDFNLLDANKDLFERLKDKLAENGLDKERLCIVSVIGKSSDSLNAATKCSLVNAAIQRGIRGRTMQKLTPLNLDEKLQIEVHIDAKNSVVLLHLVTGFDASAFVQIHKNFDRRWDENSFLDLWASINSAAALGMLLIFSISHIIIISQPEPQFDLNWLNMFRIIDNTRLKLQPFIKEMLKPLSVSKDWMRAGRMCSPRVLFLFEAYQPQYGKLNPDSIRNMERFLEDKIYNLLRKTRIITNICINSLFSIQAQAPFVFISTRDPIIRDQNKFLSNLLVNFCETGQLPPAVHEKNCDNEISEPSKVNHNGEGHRHGGNSSTIHDDVDRFSDFLWLHIDTALDRGFDDNIGKQIGTINLFEVPTGPLFLDVLLTMKDALFSKSTDNIKSIIENLRFSFDVDSRFTAGFVTHVPVSGALVGGLGPGVASIPTPGSLTMASTSASTASVQNLSQT